MARSALVAAVVVAVVATGLAPAHSLDGPADNELAVLSLDGAAEHGITEQSLDVGAAIAVQRDAAAARLDRYALAERFRRADSMATRRAVVADALAALANRSAALRADERAARRAYANGSIDAATFVRRLALLSARARQLHADVDHLRKLGDRVSAAWFEDRVSSLETGLTGFQGPVETAAIGSEGPVRARALAALRGAAPPARLYVAASTDGVVIATMNESAGRYVREAYRGDRWTVEAAERMDTLAAAELAAERYPVASNTSPGASFTGYLGGNLYRIEFTLPGGRLVAYLDSDTREPFFEVRDRSLGSLAPRDAVDRVANGTRLVVNRTYRGGPLRIAVYDNATGEPLPSTVVVAGTRLETGPDGVRWTLAPGSDRFLVIAVTPRGRVSAFVHPIDPPAVGG